MRSYRAWYNWIPLDLVTAITNLPFVALLEHVPTGVL